MSSGAEFRAALSLARRCTPRPGDPARGVRGIARGAIVIGLLVLADPAGAPVGHPRRVMTYDGLAAGALAASSGYLATSSGKRMDTGPDAPATIDGPVVVAGGPGEQLSPAIAAGAYGYLAAWETCDDCANRGADLAVRPIGPDGLPRGPTLALAASGADERAPSLAYNPAAGEFLAVWSVRYPGVAARYGVRAQRLATDGTPLGDVSWVAEVEGLWPAAVVSSRGAWHGFDVAWALPGPRQDVTATIIAARHLAADGSLSPEVWQLSDAEYEALRPLTSRASRSAGTLVAWFAYRVGEAEDRPRLRGVRLGASGRPTGGALDLAADGVCAAALADHEERSDLILATVGCDGPTAPEIGGALRVRRLSRAGLMLGEAEVMAEAVPATGLAVAAVVPDRYLVVHPATAGSRAGSEEGALAVRWLDSLGVPIGMDLDLGVLEAPAAAGGASGGAVVLAAAAGADSGYDVVAYRLLPGTPTPGPPASGTTIATPGSTSTGPVTPVTGTPSARASETAPAGQTATAGSPVASPVVPAVWIYLPLLPR